MDPLLPPIRSASRKRSSQLALTLLLPALIAFGILWHRARVENAASDRTALARREFGSDRLLWLLTRCGALRVRPAPTDADPEGERGILRYTVGGSSLGPLPSTRLGRRLTTARSRSDLISLALDPRDWDDPQSGLRANPFRRGSSWERGACLTLFRQGEPVLETTLGLRIHGDTSRARPDKSLRLVFSPTYGTHVAPTELLPGAHGETLVLHNDRRRLFFVNPIAYSIAARLGCKVPSFRPVRVAVNGELAPTVYFLTEHPSHSSLRDLLGHDDFVSFNEKSWRTGHRKPASYTNLVRRLIRGPAPPIGELERKVDLEEVLDWLATVAFCATYDCRQGVAYRDLGGDGRWRWFVWDLDWSFGPWPKFANGASLDSTTVLEELLHPYGDLRTALFARLIEDDPTFRLRFRDRVVRALNHELGPDFLGQLLARFRAIAEASGSPLLPKMLASLDKIEAFVRERPARLLSEMQQTLAFGPIHRVAIRADPGTSFLVDGHRHGKDFVGRYFEGQRVRIEAGGDSVLLEAGSTARRTMLERVVRGALDVRVQAR